MKLDAKGKAFIQNEEGCVLHTYKCAAGVDTIGYGHTGKDVKPGMTITLDQAKSYFDQDVARFELAVTKLVGATSISQNAYNALVSFCYNLGDGALGKSSLLKLVKADPQSKAIPAAFKLWCKVAGKTSAAILARRTREATLYFS